MTGVSLRDGSSTGTRAVRVAEGTVELSVVMPCLNEADTLAACIDSARKTIEDCGVAEEVVVADSGSTDSSAKIVLAHGARLVNVDVSGYGPALMGRIAAARGQFVNADCKYGNLDYSVTMRWVISGVTLITIGFQTLICSFFSSILGLRNR
jgi:glycosyltransferase involved in cell wall biosynthesis